MEQSCHQLATISPLLLIITHCRQNAWDTNQHSHNDISWKLQWCWKLIMILIDLYQVSNQIEFMNKYIYFDHCVCGMRGATSVSSSCVVAQYSATTLHACGVKRCVKKLRKTLVVPRNHHNIQSSLVWSFSWLIIFYKLSIDICFAINFTTYWWCQD